MSTVSEVCVSFFLPTDARHWIPNGVSFVDLEIDPEIVSDADQDEWYEAIEAAAEAWCEATHGVGSFAQVVWED